MGVQAVLRWIGDHIPFVPDLPPASGETERDEEQHVGERADRAIERAGRAVDLFNERIRRGYGLPGDRADR